MKTVAFVVLLSAILTSRVDAGDGAVRRAHAPIPGSYIVVLNSDIIDQPEYILDDLAKRHTAKLALAYSHVLYGGASK